MPTSAPSNTTPRSDRLQTHRPFSNPVSPAFSAGCAWNVPDREGAERAWPLFVLLLAPSSNSPFLCGPVGNGLRFGQVYPGFNADRPKGHDRRQAGPTCPELSAGASGPGIVGPAGAGGGGLPGAGN